MRPSGEGRKGGGTGRAAGKNKTKDRRTNEVSRLSRRGPVFTAANVSPDGSPVREILYLSEM